MVVVGVAVVVVVVVAVGVGCIMTGEKREEAGGFLIPGSVTIREPIWDNWAGRLLKRFGIYREREDNMYKRMMDALREDGGES